MHPSQKALLDGLAMVQWPEIKPQIWRLYHDDQGRPLFYSQEDLPGKFIDVTPQQFMSQNFNVKVINGKMIEYRRRNVKKLVPNQNGLVPCHPGDISLIVHADSPNRRWKLKDDTQS